MPLVRVHLGDLDLEAIPELDDAAGAASAHLHLGRVELVEVVAEAREGHQPAHPEALHVDEEAEVPDVGHEGPIALPLAGLQLGLQVGLQLDALAVTLGVGGVALRGGDVVRRLLHRDLALVQVLEQRAVDDQVGVAADGGGEVRVPLLGQAVVPEGFDGIACPHEGAQQPDLEGRTDG